MRTRRVLVSVVLGLAVLSGGRVGLAQSKAFMTPWGHPDLQGVWNKQTPVPLERPKELGNKTTFTKEEAAEFERTHPNRLPLLELLPTRLITR